MKPLKSIKTKFIILLAACLFTLAFFVGGAGIFATGNIIEEDTKQFLNGNVFITDPEGKIIYHSVLQTGISLSDASQELSDLEAAIREQHSADEIIQFFCQAEQIERSAMFTTLENGTKLVLTVPTVDLQRSRMRMIFRMAVMTIGIFAVVLLLAYVFLNRLDYIKDLAYQDVMTGVKNKAAFKELADELDDEIATGTAQFSVCIFDVNDLKIMNDIHGHAAGDRLIYESAELIRRIYTNSTLFRIGGDEFAVVSKGRDYDQREALLDRFHRQAKEIFLSEFDWRLQTAAGMAAFQKGDTSFKNVFERADHEMYLDKTSLKEEAKK